ncbi:MAG: mannose-6-phosphate isomerase [Lachnospiraceae bacterium]|nr:mannose-6-phosphate isomerase [Lachnospiraceae bacterium]
MDQISKGGLIRLDSPRAWRTYTGGRRLDLLHGQKNGRVTQFPEEWILSVVAARNAGREEFPEEGMSHLPEQGNRLLKEVIAADPAAVLGERHAAKYGSQTGVLVKLIDAAERLTVQVHPDKETARRLFHSDYGKTECWHILDDSPVNGVEPCIYIGFRPGITRERWKTLFERQDISGMLESMHKIPVKKGDTVLIKGGVPHAIGEGCFLMEIQEPTDYTIRVERVTPAGLIIDDSMCHQGLGFEQMFDCFAYEGVTEEEAIQRWFVKAAVCEEQPGGRRRILIGYQNTPLFRLDQIDVWKQIKMEDSPVFSGIYVLEGYGEGVANGCRQLMKPGDQFLVPAGMGKWTVEAEKDSRLKLMQFMGPKVD